MDQATEFVEQNKGMLGTVSFLAVLIAILYVVYVYLYPAADPNYTNFLKDEHDARHPIRILKSVPSIYTGGDFTFSFWIYVDDWNYKVASNKFLFAISPDPAVPTSTSPIVGMLTPIQNGLVIRANTVTASQQPPAAPPAAPTPTTSDGSPDITIEANLQAMLNQQSSFAMYQSTVDTPCDIKEVPLQRWVNITIVSSGRVLDVYMDGKLSRSCVLENVVNVPRGPLRLRLGESGGFGGRYSSVQMWSQAMTPDVIYGIYMMGPTQGVHNIFADISKWLNLNVSFTGPAPAPGQAQASPFSAMTQQGSAIASRL
jgi:hypothetical protein